MMEIWKESIKSNTSQRLGDQSLVNLELQEICGQVIWE